MAYESAPYIYKSGKWKNANDALDIRGKNSMSGTPTTETVPKMFARSSGDWKQIYPPLAIPGTPDKVEGSGLRCYVGCKADMDKGRPLWAWAYDHEGTSDTAGMGWFGDGSDPDDHNSRREYAGWLGFDQDFLRSKKFAGTKAFTGSAKVKQVKSFKMHVMAREGAGNPYYARPLCIIGSNCPEPKNVPPGSRDWRDGPIDHPSRIGPFKSDNIANFRDSDGKLVRRTFTFSRANGGEHGKKACELMEKYLNGEINALYTYNGSTKGGKDIFGNDVAMYHTTLAATGRFLLMSQDYMKFTEVSMEIDYEYEP